jgi:hypothetical protein
VVLIHKKESYRLFNFSHLLSMKSESKIKQTRIHVEQYLYFSTSSLKKPALFTIIVKACYLESAINTCMLQLYKVVIFSDSLQPCLLGRISVLNTQGDNLIVWPVFGTQVVNTEEIEVNADDLASFEQYTIHMPTDRVGIPLHLPVQSINSTAWVGS